MYMIAISTHYILYIYIYGYLQNYQQQSSAIG